MTFTVTFTSGMKYYIGTANAVCSTNTYSAVCMYIEDGTLKYCYTRSWLDLGSVCHWCTTVSIDGVHTFEENDTP